MLAHLEQLVREHFSRERTLFDPAHRLTSKEISLALSISRPLKERRFLPFSNSSFNMQGYVLNCHDETPVGILLKLGISQERYSYSADAIGSNPNYLHNLYHPVSDIYSRIKGGVSRK